MTLALFNLFEYQVYLYAIRIHSFNLNQVAQDVPRYMMVAGDRAELRGLNIEGLRRNGFSDQEVFIYIVLKFGVRINKIRLFTLHSA